MQRSFVSSSSMLLDFHLSQPDQALMLLLLLVLLVVVVVVLSCLVSNPTIPFVSSFALDRLTDRVLHCTNLESSPFGLSRVGTLPTLQASSVCPLYKERQYSNRHIQESGEPRFRTGSSEIMNLDKGDEHRESWSPQILSWKMRSEPFFLVAGIGIGI